MNKFSKALFLFTILLVLSCNSKSNIVQKGDCDNCKEAMVLNFGDPALDGCGWMLEVSSDTYMVNNLPSEFRVDSLKVQVEYKIGEIAKCGVIGTEYQSVIVTKIVRKQ
ncbi:MAG: hypothetical protein ABJM06_12785 [Gilvibacter sp.]